MNSCLNCKQEVQDWLGDHDYCLDCLNDQTVMSQALEASFEPLGDNTFEPVEKPEEPLELGVHSDFGWNDHLGNYTAKSQQGWE